MESKELRIGNFVSTSIDGTAIYLVEEIKMHVLFLSNQRLITDIGEVQYHNIHPIPLTEEWLLKFGFVKVRDYPVFRLNGLQIEFNGFDSEWGAGLLDKKTIIKYVHQLQNLYFALTGKELTIKN